MNILITSAGRRVSLVRAFKKQLNKISSEARVLAAEANPDLSAACQVADDYFKVPMVFDPDYMDHLLNQCIEKQISLIIPTIDAELRGLALDQERFAANNIKVVVPAVDFVEQCRDKRQIHDFFKSKGIAVAEEYPKTDFKLPMFIKPTDGSRSIGAALIRTINELDQEQLENEKMMFLQYLDHDCFDEYTCDLYYDKTNILRCAVPRKRIEVRDGEVNKGLTLNFELVEVLRKKLHFIKGAIGCLTAQFFVHKKDPSQVYGIEINPRFGGGYPLSYQAGANFPLWLIKEYLLKETLTDQFDSWEANLLMLRYDDEIIVHGFEDKG